MSKWLDSLQPFGAFVMRLALGLCMVVNGYRKVIPNGALHHHAHYVVALGFPYWLGYISAFTEFIGGGLLIVGLLTRVAAALIAIDMLVALLWVGIHQGFGVYNYLGALVALALMILFYGPGTAALDRNVGLS